MDILFDILKWIGFIAGGFAVAGALVVAAMALLLNRPIHDDEPRRSARGC